ncbi:MAG: glycosyltransferase [Clostridia bacterium]|nr:glycosyltransferase [Clostridia bacterium]
MSNLDKPLVSIVIPVYNGSDYLNSAIDSALAQTYSNIEIIVVNDGSNDDGATERIARSYGEKICYFKKENGGCSSALNYGISKMNGEYFSWLSHDDLYEPNKIEASVNAISENLLHPHNTVVCCKSSVINKDGVEIRRDLTKAKGRINSMEMLDKLFNHGNLNGCALLIPKRILDEVGDFSTEYIYILDFMYWVNIALKGFDFFEIGAVAAKNRRHANQVSVRKSHLLSKEMKQFISELIESIDGNKAKLFILWQFCKRKGLKEEAKIIEGKIDISLKSHLVAGIKRCVYLLMALLKKVYRKIYGIGALK